MGAPVRIDRLTRVRMLLMSFLDAYPGLESRAADRIRTQPGSSMPLTGYLWRGGSYQELEDGLEELSLVSRQRLWRAYVWQPDRRRRSVQLIYRQKQSKNLNHDLRSLSDVMPRRIRVPKDVRLNWVDYVQTPAEKNKVRMPFPSYDSDNNSRSAPAAPVQTGNSERERLGGHD